MPRIVDSDDDDDGGQQSDGNTGRNLQAAHLVAQSRPSAATAGAGGGGAGGTARVPDNDDDEDDDEGPVQRRNVVRFSAAEKGKGKAAAMSTRSAGPVELDDDVEMADEEQEGDIEADGDLDLDDVDEVAGGSGGGQGRKKNGAKGTTFSWEEEYTRSWDALTEDVHGSLEGAVAAFLTSSKRRRILRDTAAVQRGIIRHVFLVLDLSEAMTDRDMRPSRLDVTLKYAQEFVGEFFDQNPISQLAIVGTRDGMAERISPLGGNPVEHVKALQNKRKLAASGEPSLQNALNMARSGLAHLPTHGSREVIIIFGSLTSCDPGNIHDTIEALVKDRVRVNIIGLAAELSVCREISKKTRGTFHVCLNEDHYKDLLFEHILPPASLKPAAGGPIPSGNTGSGADLMLMGFPTLLTQTQYASLCSCHSKLYKSRGYICPRCNSKLCEVPTECGICRLTIVASPHLARSYRHLFPVMNWEVVNAGDTEKMPKRCFGCSVLFPPPDTLSTTTVPSVPPQAARTDARTANGKAPSRPAPTNGEVVVQQTKEAAAAAAAGSVGTISATGRYRCPKCRNMFCIDCDIFTHQLGACPGCQ